MTITASNVTDDQLDALNDLLTTAEYRIAVLERENEALRQAAKWNDSHNIGTPVRYWSVRGDITTATSTTTRSAAWVLDSGTAVVHVDGVSGCVALSHVEAVDRG